MPPEYLYHGRTPTDDRWLDSRSGTLVGEAFRIYEVDAEMKQKARKYRAHALDNAPGIDIVNEYDAEITGGMTANLGAAIKFHQSLSTLGSVFVIDPRKLPKMPTQVQYNYEWAQDHPGTFARVDSMADFEVYDSGELLGAGYHREDGAPLIDTWTENIEYKINNFAYADENEYVCYGTSNIDFSNALAGTATYAHVNRAVGGSIQGALDEYDGYRMGFARRGNEDITNMSHEEKARALHTKLIEAHGGGGSLVDQDHTVVLYDQEQQRVRDEVTHIDPEAFILAVNGRRTYRNPVKISYLLGL